MVAALAFGKIPYRVRAGECPALLCISNKRAETGHDLADQCRRQNLAFFLSGRRIAAAELIAEIANQRGRKPRELRMPEIWFYVQLDVLAILRDGRALEAVGRTIFEPQCRRFAYRGRLAFWRVH